MSTILINKWKRYLGIKAWSVTTEFIDLESVSVEYNGHTYFVGILRNFNEKEAIIFHDVELDEETIIHELLHIVFPKPNSDEVYEEYEQWIADVAHNLNQIEKDE